MMEKMLVLALVLVLPLSALGQDEVPSSLLNLTVAETDDGDGFIATWIVPEGAPEFRYFYLYITSLKSTTHWVDIYIYRSDARLTRTGNTYTFTFSGFLALVDYYAYTNVYGHRRKINVGGPHLINVVGYVNSYNQYWFSDDAIFDPNVESTAAFELSVTLYGNPCTHAYGSYMAKELTTVIRSLSVGFVRRRGTISPIEFTCHEEHVVFRGTIRVWGNKAFYYRKLLHQWLNASLDSGGRKLHINYDDDSYYWNNDFESFPVLLTEGPCGFNISSIYDPYCGPMETINTNAPTTVTMTTKAVTPTNTSTSTTTKATDPPTLGGTESRVTLSSNPQSTTLQSDGSGAVLHVTMAVACIAIVLSMLVVVGLVLYIVVMKRKKHNSKQERSMFMESPLYANNRLSEDPGLEEETALDDKNEDTLY